MDETTKAKEKAAKLWARKSAKTYAYTNPSLAYLEGISDYQSSVIEELEKELGDYAEECHQLIKNLDIYE